MTTDGYDPQEHAEQIDAVRAVAREALERESDWSALAQAGLLGLGIPEEHGGDGLGLLEVGVLLREAGTRARQLPLWETLVCGGLVLAAHGTDTQRKELLPGIVSGEVGRPPGARRPAGGLAHVRTDRPAHGRPRGRAGRAARGRRGPVADRPRGRGAVHDRRRPAGRRP